MILVSGMHVTGKAILRRSSLSLWRCCRARLAANSGDVPSKLERKTDKEEEVRVVNCIFFSIFVFVGVFLVFFCEACVAVPAKLPCICWPRWSEFELFRVELCVILVVRYEVERDKRYPQFSGWPLFSKERSHQMDRPAMVDK